MTESEYVAILFKLYKKLTKIGERMKEKTESISLNHWESITLYQLVKNQYCDIVDALQSTKATRTVMKDYNKLMDKLENIIGKTSEYDEG